MARAPMGACYLGTGCEPWAEALSSSGVRCYHTATMAQSGANRISRRFISLKLVGALLALCAGCSPDLRDEPCDDDSECLIGERCVESTCTTQFQAETDLDAEDQSDDLADQRVEDVPGDSPVDEDRPDEGDPDTADGEPDTADGDPNLDDSDQQPIDTNDVEVDPADAADGDLGDTDSGDSGTVCHRFGRTRAITLFERCNPFISVHSDLCLAPGSAAFGEPDMVGCSSLSRKDEIVDIPLENVRLDHSIAGYLQFDDEDFSNGSVGPTIPTFQEPSGVAYLESEWGQAVFLQSHPLELLPSPVTGKEPATVAFWYHLCAGEECPAEGGITLFDTTAETDKTALTVGITPGERATLTAGFSQGEASFHVTETIAAVPDKEWHHVGIVLHGPNSIRVYHDGHFVPIDTRSGPFELNFEFVAARIGHAMEEGGVTPMGLDEVIVATRAFSAAEMRILAQSRQVLSARLLEPGADYTASVAAVQGTDGLVAAPYEIIGARPGHRLGLDGMRNCYLSFDDATADDAGVSFSDCPGDSVTLPTQGADVGRFGYVDDHSLLMTGTAAFVTGVVPDLSGSIIEGWFWFNSAQSGIWSIAGDHSLSLLSSGALNLSRSDEADCVTEPVVQEGRWNHIAMLIRDSEVALYLNGVELSFADLDRCLLDVDGLSVALGGVSESTSFAVDEFAVSSDLPSAWELRSRVWPELPTLRLFASTIETGESDCPNQYPEYMLAWQPIDGVEPFVNFGGCDRSIADCLGYAAAWDFETGVPSQELLLDLTGENDLQHSTDKCSVPRFGTEEGASGMTAGFPTDDECFEANGSFPDESAALTVEALLLTRHNRSEQTLLSLGGAGGRLIFGVEVIRPVLRLDDSHPDSLVAEPSSALGLSQGVWHHVVIAHQVGSKTVSFSVDGLLEVVDLSDDEAATLELYLNGYNHTLVGSTGPGHTGTQ